MSSWIETLTTAQAAQLEACVERWTAVALRTGPTPRRPFIKAARCCYEAAGLAWHGNVVWVDSPLVLALAGPIAAFTIPWQRHGLPAAALHGVTGAAVGAAVRAAADHFRGVTAGDVRGAMQAAIHTAVQKAAGGHARPAVRLTAQAVRVVLDSQQGEAFLHDARLHAALNSVASGSVRSALDRACAVLDGATAGTFRDARQAAAAAVEAAAAAAQSMDDSLGGERIGRRLAHFLGPREIPFQGMALGLQACTCFLREVCGLKIPGGLGERALALEQAVQAGGWWFPHADFLMVCERPEQIHHEVFPGPRGPAAHRLHRSDGPAMSWPGGWTLHVVHGRRVPGWIIEEPGRVTVAAIEAQSNAEVRRVMIERYGVERYLREAGAEVVDACGADHPVAGLRGARLLRKAFAGERELRVYLDMVNSTPEPDGTFKRYLERIDPKVYGGDAGRLCHAAMASRWHYVDEFGGRVRTFARWQDYLPDAES